MTRTRSSGGTVVNERATGTRLENMSSRPTTVVTHTARRKACQLVPSLRVAIGPRVTELATEIGRPLEAFGLPPAVERADPVEQARVTERVCRAVIADLRLPAVIPLAPGGELLDEESRDEPLLALVALTRCSGPVWLRDRAPALERLTVGRPVRLLLQPALFRHVIGRLETRGWAGQVLDRVEGLEGWL